MPDFSKFYYFVIQMLFVRFGRGCTGEIENKGQKITSMEHRGKHGERNRREIVALIQPIFARRLTLLRISIELDPMIDNDTTLFTVMYL